MDRSAMLTGGLHSIMTTTTTTTTTIIASITISMTPSSRLPRDYHIVSTAINVIIIITTIHRFDCSHFHEAVSILPPILASVDDGYVLVQQLVLLLYVRMCLPVVVHYVCHHHHHHHHHYHHHHHQSHHYPYSHHNHHKIPPRVWK